MESTWAASLWSHLCDEHGNLKISQKQKRNLEMKSDNLQSRVDRHGGNMKRA